MGTAKVKSGSKEGKVQYPYDAMVYIDGTVVYAVDKEGNVISRGVAGTDDAAVIQNVLDKPGVFNVIVSKGTYYLSSNLYITKSGTYFYGEGYNTVFEKTGAGSKTILIQDCNDCKVGNYKTDGISTIAKTSSSTEISGIVFDSILATGNICDAISVYLKDPTTTAQYIRFNNCRAVNTGTAFILVSNVDGAVVRDIEFINCEAINSGVNYRSNAYNIGFSIENVHAYNVTFINCKCSGSWESGFHEESWYDRYNIRYIGCTSEHNAQRTLLSTGIIDNEDLTKSTPFTCTNYPIEYSSSHMDAGAKKLHIRIHSSTITNFSITITQGSLVETVDETTYLVTNPTGSMYDFYTVNSFAGFTVINSVVVNSVTSASSGDTLCIGQDATYGYAFMTRGSTIIGCTAQSDIIGKERPGIVHARSSTRLELVGNRLINTSTVYPRYTIYVGSNLVQCDFESIQSAISYINNQGTSDTYTIELLTDTSSTSDVLLPSNVVLDGNNHTLSFTIGRIIIGDSKTNIHIKDLVINTITPCAIQLNRCSDVLIENVTAISDPCSAGCFLIWLNDGGYTGCTDVVFKDCTFRIGGTNNNSYCFMMGWFGDVHLVDCVIENNNTAQTSIGLQTGYNSKLTMDRCTVKSGFGTSSVAAHIQSSVANISGCTFISRGNAAYTLRLAGYYNDILLSNCISTFEENISSFEYTGSSYEILPVSGYDWTMLTIEPISVTVAGGTLNIGTTDGGNEIAGPIDISTTGNKVVTSIQTLIPSGSPVYVKPTDTSARFKFVYCWGHVGGTSVYNSYENNVNAIGCKFISSIGKNCCYVGSSIAKLYFNGCMLKCLGGGFVATGASNTNIYSSGCKYIGCISTVRIDEILEQLQSVSTSVLEIMSSARLLIPCDTHTGTTIYDFTRNANNLTASSSVFNIVGNVGYTWYYNFNGSSHYLYRANDTDFDFGNSTTDSAFSVVVAINPDSSTSRFLIGKWDANNAREWRLFLDASGYPTLQLYDESVDKYIGRQDQTAFTTGSWKILVATYDGSGICAGCKVYIDGVQLDDADYTDAGYVAMEAVTANLMVGALKNAAAYSEYYDGKMTWIGIAAKELSADEVWSLTQRLKGVLGI